MSPLKAIHAPGTPSIALRRSESYVEAEVADVAVDHDVVLAFHADLARGLGGCHGTRVDEVVEGDDFGLDEAAFEVGVDDAGGLGGGVGPAVR